MQTTEQNSKKLNTPASIHPLQGYLKKVVVAKIPVDGGYFLKRMKLKRNIAVSESGFLFDPTNGESYSLNEQGLEILNLLKKSKSDNEITSYMTETYDIPADEFAIRAKRVLEEYGCPLFAPERNGTAGGAVLTKFIDMGYKNLAPMTFSFEESQEIAREVWDAYGATAFSAPSGNMILELVNLAAAKAIASVKGEQ